MSFKEVCGGTPGERNPCAFAVGMPICAVLAAEAVQCADMASALTYMGTESKHNRCPQLLGFTQPLQLTYTVDRLSTTTQLPFSHVQRHA